jgi:predicted Fe-S protein YdhL (DUF1289 family)
MLESPCINICKMDSVSGLCIGCFRSIDEISAWSRTDDLHRARILVAVAQRRQEQSKLQAAGPR